MGRTRKEVKKHMPVLYDWKTRGSTSIRWHSLLLMGTAKEPKETQDTMAAIQPLAACHSSNIVDVVAGC